MFENTFFKKRKPVHLSQICKLLKCKMDYKNEKISNISELSNAKKDEISFFNSIKYLDNLKKTNAKYILSQNKHFNIVKKYKYPILVKNVFTSVSELTNFFYPDSLNDTIDYYVNAPKRKILIIYYLVRMF